MVGQTVYEKGIEINMKEQEKNILQRQKSKPAVLKILFPIAVTTVGLVPYRECSAFDWYADVSVICGKRLERYLAFVRCGIKQHHECRHHFLGTFGGRYYDYRSIPQSGQPSAS